MKKFFEENLLQQGLPVEKNYFPEGNLKKKFQTINSKMPFVEENKLEIMSTIKETPEWKITTEKIYEVAKVEIILKYKNENTYRLGFNQTSNLIEIKYVQGMKSSKSYRLNECLNCPAFFAEIFLNYLKENKQIKKITMAGINKIEGTESAKEKGIRAYDIFAKKIGMIGDSSIGYVLLTPQKN